MLLPCSCIAVWLSGCNTGGFLQTFGWACPGLSATFMEKFLTRWEPYPINPTEVSTCMKNKDHNNRNPQWCRGTHFMMSPSNINWWYGLVSVMCRAPSKGTLDYYTGLLPSSHMSWNDSNTQKMYVLLLLFFLFTDRAHLSDHVHACKSPLPPFLWYYWVINPNPCQQTTNSGKTDTARREA